MKAPDKLYVVPMKTESQDAFVGLAYELDKILVGKTEYIRKDLIKAFLEGYAIDALDKYNSNSEDADYWTGKHTACVDFLDMIDRL